MLHYIILLKFRKKVDKELYEKVRSLVNMRFEDIKPYGLYFMMGSYDAVWHIETESLIAAAKLLNKLREIGEIIMMPAFSLDEAVKIVE